MKVGRSFFVLFEFLEIITVMFSDINQRVIFLCNKHKKIPHQLYKTFFHCISNFMKFFIREIYIPTSQPHNNSTNQHKKISSMSIFQFLISMHLSHSFTTANTQHHHHHRRHEEEKKKKKKNNLRAANKSYCVMSISILSLVHSLLTQTYNSSSGISRFFF